MVPVIEKQLIDALKMDIAAYAELIAQDRPLESLLDMHHDATLRLTLRKYQVMLHQLLTKEYSVHFAEHGAPASARHSLYSFSFPVCYDAEGRPLGVLLAVLPGADAELDALMRESNDLARAVADELVGSFNNLSLDERERRTRRIIELRRDYQAAPGPVERGRIAEEMAALGVHEWLELDAGRFLMRVDSAIANPVW